MGKQSKKGQHHQHDGDEHHHHHKTGSGSHHHHKLHEGPMYQKYHKKHSSMSEQDEEQQQQQQEPPQQLEETIPPPTEAATETTTLEESKPPVAADDTPADSAPAFSYVEDPYIKTATGNYVSRQAVIDNATAVEIKGKSWILPDARLRGDRAKIRMGRYCQVGPNVTLEPAPSGASSAAAYVPLSVGSHTVIGPDCHIQAAAIGSYCSIGANVKLGPRVILKDGVVIEDGTVLGDDTVIGPFTRVSNATMTTTTTSDSSNPRPLLRQVELPPATMQLLQEESMEAYQSFVAERNQWSMDQRRAAAEAAAAT